ncbi:MAG: glycosyltransferase, partial [Rhodobacteraceae bacterium]|nr:glycosyltransferase [Paracoccaceae bacterium]
RYLGPVTLDQAEDPAHHSTRPDGSFVSLAEWQAAWGEMIYAADEVVVFSQDSAQQVKAAYPKASIEVRPHQMLHEVPNLLAAKTSDQRSVKAPMVVAVLGNLNEIKGAGVLADLARKVKTVPDLSLVLIGNIDPMFVLPKSVPVHGDYRVKDLPGLVTRYGITAWLIPSIWPETFSYTTHEALATGLPVYCFDLGGQAEAAARAENGHVVDFDRDGAFAETMLKAFQNHKDP